jgi:hypothetical protein
VAREGGWKEWRLAGFDNLGEKKKARQAPFNQPNGREERGVTGGKNGI